jgi:hypothetical protein
MGIPQPKGSGAGTGWHNILVPCAWYSVGQSTIADYNGGFETVYVFAILLCVCMDFAQAITIVLGALGAIIALVGPIGWAVAVVLAAISLQFGMCALAAGAYGLPMVCVEVSFIYALGKVLDSEIPFFVFRPMASCCTC